MNDSSGDRNPVELLAEEFIARKRRGEKPTLSEYTDQYPHLAADIRDLFPALLMMEDLGEQSLASTGPDLGDTLRQGTPIIRQLGEYRILREVGRGGMGVVYEAEQQSLGRRVALKVLPPHVLNDAQRLQRFEREARAAAKLHHTNIVPVFGVGHQEHTHYYVMQFIQGLGLDNVLEELRSLREGPTRQGRQLVGVAAPESPAQVKRVVHSLVTGQFNEEGARSASAVGPNGKAASSTEGVSDSAVPRLPDGSDLSSVSGDETRYWRSVARIGVQVAVALEYAHGQGILHRDIKPSNLLMDMKGTVWVTDFGLAKAGDSKDLTHTGDVVGTVRYMAPERFQGRSDARSDVYSLGLTLYEMLALRPAFDQRDRAKVMQQVMHEEPPRLRKLNPAVPRDLETIVQKAIAKEPNQRYARAADLAADLQRFLEDRPIQARRASGPERLWRWCRRNPALATLMSLLLLVLVSGATTSTILAMEAMRRADDATREKDDAIAARNELRQANTQLTESQEELKKTNDRLLTSVAQSKLLPLAALPRSPGEQLPPLSKAEVDVLWELASSPDEELRVRFVKEASHTPRRTRQLLDRWEYALHAAVGLDATRRARVEDLLAEQMQAAETSPEHQWQIAVLLARFGVQDQAVADKVGRTLIQGVRTTKDSLVLQSLAEGLLAAAEWREAKEPKEAAALRGQAAGAFIRAMSVSPPPVPGVQSSEGKVATNLVALAKRMKPNEAAGILTRALRTAKDDDALWSLAGGLVNVAARLESKEASECAVAVILALKTRKNPGRWTSDGRELPVVLRRLEPKEAAECAALLSQWMNTTKDGFLGRELARHLVAVAVRMEPNEAAAILSQMILVTEEPYVLSDLAGGLSAVAERLEPKRAATVCGQAAHVLTQAKWRIRQHRDQKKQFALNILARGLTALAIRMEPKDAIALLTEAIRTTNDLYELGIWAEGWSAPAIRLEPKEAAECAAMLAQALSATKDSSTLSFLAKCLAAVAERMEPKEAAAVCSQTVTVLTQAMKTEKDLLQLVFLVDSLLAVAERIEPKEASAIRFQAATVFTQAINTTKNWIELSNAAGKLSAVTQWMEPKASAALRAQFAKAFIRVMSVTENFEELRLLALSLSRVVPHMERMERAAFCGQAAALLTVAMTVTKNKRTFHSLTSGLSYVAVWLEPKAAAECATALTQTMCTTDDPELVSLLAKALPPVAARLEPEEAAGCTTALTQAMNTTTNPNLLAPLATALAAVIKRMEPRATASIQSQAAKILLLAISTTKDPDGLQSLMLALVLVGKRLEPKEAADCAAIWIETMSTTKVLNIRLGMRFEKRYLSALLFRKHPDDLDKRNRAVAGTFATLGGTGLPLTTPALLVPALEPLPPLPAQALVDLLKHPLCVGEARRLMLEQLSRHYDQSFTDQWEFVEYARLHQLDLDLATPPQKPYAAVRE